MLYLKNSFLNLIKNSVFKISIFYGSAAFLYGSAVNYSHFIKAHESYRAFWAYSIACLILSAVTSVILYHFINSNVLDFKKLNKEKESNLKKLQLCFNNIPAGIVIVDANSSITQWNPEAERIFGFGKNEALGNRSFKKMLPPDVRIHLEKYIDEIRYGSDTSLICDKFDLKSGNWISCQWKFASLYDESKRYRGLMCVVSEIGKEDMKEKESEINAQIETVLNIYNLDGSKSETEYPESEYLNTSEMNS